LLWNAIVPEGSIELALQASLAPVYTEFFCKGCFDRVPGGGSQPHVALHLSWKAHEAQKNEGRQSAYQLQLRSIL
jgi:hypothetical protein